MKQTIRQTFTDSELRQLLLLQKLGLFSHQSIAEILGCTRQWVEALSQKLIKKQHKQFSLWLDNEFMQIYDCRPESYCKHLGIDAEMRLGGVTDDSFMKHESERFLDYLLSKASSTFQIEFYMNKQGRLVALAGRKVSISE